MDDSRFDAWLKALADGGNRRQILRPLTAGATAVALSRLGFGAAEAKKKRKRKKRCIKLGDSCRPGGRACCHQRTCGGPPEARFCCQQGGESCGVGPDCCNLTCLQGLCALN